MYFQKRMGIYPVNTFLQANPAEMEGSPFYLWQSGRAVWCRNFRCTRVDTGKLAVEYITDGEFCCLDETGWHPLHPGDLFLMMPSGKCTLKCLSRTGVKQTFGFAGPALAPTLEQLGIGIRIRYFHPENLVEWERRSGEARALLKEGGRSALSAFALEILLAVSDLSRRGDSPKALVRALDFIARNIRRKIGLQQLAEELGMSPVSVIRFFSRHLGTTPGEYIRRKRIETAEELLRSGEYSVKEVAAEMNYSSPQYFAAEFRKLRGCAPGAAVKR